jgi:hypothetical protein
MQDHHGSTLSDRVKTYPLLEALIHRRSRRFGKGMQLNGGPLAYDSVSSPEPLTLEEEAALAFAACGVTGYALGDLPYETGDTPEASSGNIMTHFIARSVGSGDAIHSVTMFVMNDDGAWMLNRPQDFPRAEIPTLIQQARDHQLVELYERSRVRIADRRPEIPREPPFTPPFNKWSANVPGTSYFLPVNEFTALYINIMLSAFSDELRYFVVDERNRFQPAGVGKFARSKGGHLHDNPEEKRFGTVSSLETWLYEFAALEQGAMLQNLGLMTQALGLGGFQHFAAHPFIWFSQLGFRMEQIPLSRTIGAGPIYKLLLKAAGKDLAIPTPVGLEYEGQTLIKPYCPPYYRNMEEAVIAFVDHKYAPGTGTFRDGGAITGWQSGAAVQDSIARYPDEAIDATISYCEYVYQRYGRFPATSGPFRSILAHQAHHLDLDFYQQFYRPETIPDNICDGRN